MRSPLLVVSRSMTLAACAGLSSVATVACSDAPLGPRRAAERLVASRAAGASHDSITALGNGVYRLVVHHPCTGAAGVLDLGKVFGDSSAARLMKIDRGPNCGCAPTIPPPSWMKGYTCTLTSWECDDHSSSCNYQCKPPDIVYV